MLATRISTTLIVLAVLSFSTPVSMANDLDDAKSAHTKQLLTLQQKYAHERKSANSALLKAYRERIAELKEFNRPKAELIEKEMKLFVEGELKYISELEKDAGILGPPESSIADVKKSPETNLLNLVEFEKALHAGLKELASQGTQARRDLVRGSIWRDLDGRLKGKTLKVAFPINDVIDRRDGKFVIEFDSPTLPISFTSRRSSYYTTLTPAEVLSMNRGDQLEFEGKVVVMPERSYSSSSSDRNGFYVFTLRSEFDSDYAYKFYIVDPKVTTKKSDM